MNTQTQLTLTRLKRAKQSRYNPLIGISDPTQIAQKLDSFEAGYFREAVNIWDTLEQRDDLIRTVVSKRKKSAGREGWVVLPKDNLTPGQQEEAQTHVAALEYFYDNVKCENALDNAEKGGFKLLARQMMDAVGKRFAVHEIIWNVQNSAERQTSPSALSLQPSALLSATFRFVPLSFFENTSGSLRFLESESATTGTPLDPGAWMVTVGEGLMMATASAWITKHLALNDWLIYSERNGRPGLRATTSSTPESPEWNHLETALGDILNGGAVIHNSSDDIKVLDLAAGGNIPFPLLVERIDRMIATLWRGADLSTLSRDRGYGASLQEKETCALEDDDAEMLTETLNRYVDEWVIRYLFGDGVKPLANVKVLVTPSACTTLDLEVDKFLLQSGAELSLQETMSRYGRALPKAGEEVLRAKPGEKVLKAKPDERVPQSIRTPGHQTPNHAHERANSFETEPDPQFQILNERPVGPVPSPGGPPLNSPPQASYPESSHTAETQTANVLNSEDAHDCESPSTVSFRDSSPGSVPPPPTENENLPLEPEPKNLIHLDPSAPSVVENQTSSCSEETFDETLTSPRTEGTNPQCQILNSQFSILNEAGCSVSVADAPSFPPLSSVQPEPIDSALIPNEFDILQQDWVQLSPYGDFPHSRGLQRVNRSAADAMVAQFNSFRGRLGRLFGGAPFYVGHPDLPNTGETVDRKAYGWIMQLEARADGLYGQVKWSDAGLNLLKNAHFKYFSPYWEAKELMSENGRKVYQPVALVSVGLTNQPNIPVKPLANETNDSRRRGHETQTTEPIEVPGSPENLETQPADNIESLSPSVTSCLREPQSQGDEPVARSERKNTEREPNEEDQRRSTPPKFPILNSQFSILNPPSCLEPKISTPPDTSRPSIKPNPPPLAPPSPTPMPNQRRDNLLASLHTTCLTRHIGRRRPDLARMDNTKRLQDRILEAVQIKMSLGLSYDHAWDLVKREHHEWFANTKG